MQNQNQTITGYAQGVAHVAVGQTTIAINDASEQVAQCGSLTEQLEKALIGLLEPNAEKPPSPSVGQLTQVLPEIPNQIRGISNNQAINNDRLRSILSRLTL